MRDHLRNGLVGPPDWGTKSKSNVGEHLVQRVPVDGDAAAREITRDGTKTVVQIDYDATGRLVHYHPKQL